MSVRVAILGGGPAGLGLLEGSQCLQGSPEAFLDPLRVSRALIYRACA